MTWTVVFLSDRVETEIPALSAGFVARFFRYAERMEMYGPDLGMPHTRAMATVCLNFALKQEKALRVFSIAQELDAGL